MLTIVDFRFWDDAVNVNYLVRNDGAEYTPSLDTYVAEGRQYAPDPVRSAYPFPATGATQAGFADSSGRRAVARCPGSPPASTSSRSRCLRRQLSARMVGVNWWPTSTDLNQFLDAFWPQFVATILGVAVGVPIALWFERGRRRHEEQRQATARRIEAIARGRRVCHKAADELMSAYKVGAMVVTGKPSRATLRDLSDSLEVEAQELNDYARHDAHRVGSPLIEESVHRLQRMVGLTAWVVRGAWEADAFVLAGASSFASNLSTWARELADRLSKSSAGKRWS